MRRFFLASCFVVWAGTSASGQVPDVIVGDLQEVASWGRVGDTVAYSVGTTSCNVGTAELLWVADTPEHPVIGQELYRYKDGRFEQIGFSWLKHAFCALSQNLCDPCNPTGCETLGIGCSDPYTAGRNGTQSTAGPRSEVNAWLGEFPYPFGGPTGADPIIGRRIQVDVDDVDPQLNAGAVYFAEGHYVTADDAMAGNGENNVSYREVVFGTDPTEFPMDLAPGSSTVQEEPAIYAWQDLDPSVEIVEVRVPGEGLLLLGYDVTEVGGSFVYEYAIYNMNSDISAGSFTLEKSSSATILAEDFFHVPYHSGEPYSTDPWDITVGPDTIAWSTEDFATNPDANALRWSRMFNFRFESDSAPVTVDATVGMFKNSDVVTVPVLGPGDPPVPTPEDFTCVGGPTGVQLDWTNPTGYSEIIVRRGSVTVATLPGTATSFFDSGAQQGQTYFYTLEAFDGSVPANVVGCTVVIPVFTEFSRADANLDGTFDLSDAVYCVNALFVPGADQPVCADAADTNDDGVFDVSDAVYALFSLFVPGASPIPEPIDCSWDPTIDGLECDDYPCP